MSMKINTTLPSPAELKEEIPLSFSVRVCGSSGESQ